MAERHRSNDGSKDSEMFVDGNDAAVTGEMGRESGDLARKTGTKDDLRKAEDARAGVTRVTKSDEVKAGTDNLGERNK